MRSIAASTFVALALLIGTDPAAAQSPTTGSLLVATDQMLDPNFKRSVLLILHYGEDGALGVLINRPTNLDPAEAFPQAASFADYAGKVFFGGPVGPTQLLMLMRAPSRDLVRGPPVVGDVYIGVDPENFDSAIAGGSDSSRVRFYAGHAAWAPQQLDGEIAAGSWRVVSGRADLVFADDPLSLWEQVVHTERELVVESKEPERPASADALPLLRTPEAPR